MTRPLGIFPYSPDGYGPTYSDGIVSSAPVNAGDGPTSVFMPSPTGGVQGNQFQPYTAGERNRMEMYYANTYLVYCNQVWYLMQAGDAG